MKRARQALILIAVGANLSLALLPARAQGAKASAHPAAVRAPHRAMAQTSKRVVNRPARRVTAPIIHDGEAEARLIEIYRLIGQANSREAISKAESLIKDHPNFQLAQLVYGDLLSGRTRPVRSLGDVPDTTAQAGATILAELRQESALRLRALRERPAPGTVPSQFLSLSARTRHAIAVDTSRARLYLFENTPAGLKLLADYYISVGKLGIEKSAEGDLRTPLGVYFISSNLDPQITARLLRLGRVAHQLPQPA